VTSYHWSPDQLEHVRRVTESALAEPDRLVSHDRLVTTAEMAVTLRAGGSDRSFNHAVEQCAPLQLPGSRLPLPPYLLGVWLGHGALPAGWNRDGKVQGILRTIGVLDNKHLPQQYLRASEVQRRALLAGLLDTDGTVTPTGHVQFTCTDQRLAANVRELVVSPGYRCGVSRKRVPGPRVATRTAYTITFTTT